MKSAYKSLGAALLLATCLGAQGPRGPVWKPEVNRAWNIEYRDLSQLVVKFVEGKSIRLRQDNGTVVEWVGAAGLAKANAILQKADHVERLFERSEKDLDAERAALMVDLARGMDAPADLNNYYRITASDEKTGLQNLNALLALDLVETAFPEHRQSFPCDPGDIPPVTPDFSGTQGHRSAAPLGIDHFAARTIPGGRGFGRQFIDIESSWRLNHEDLPLLVAKNVIGTHTESLNPNHGVAVVGEIAGEWDRFGITGITDQVSLKVHSHMRRNWASSVNVAAKNSPKGGFIVLEVQLSLGGKLTPMEVRQDVFDATRNAVLAGKYVIAAAGNGGNDLDSTFFNNLFNRTKRDSGSIIVGATNGSKLARASFSNHGSIVDANGWGYNVVTTGYGNLFNPSGDVKQQYTKAFSGTSSATPIVTGACIALVGAHLEQNGKLLTPAQLRDLLHKHGTAVPNGRIGLRPDLAKLLKAVGLPRGLRILKEAGTGQSIQLQVEGKSGDIFLFMLSLDRGFIDLGTMGRFLLDLNSPFLSFVGSIPTTGKTPISLPIPNLKTLDRKTVFMQTLLISGQTLKLTNSTSNYIL